MARPTKEDKAIQELTPVLYPLEKLKPDPLNPNIHPASQIAALAKSMKRFGARWPILARADDTIVVGHGRREAAIKAKFTVYPVIRVPDGWTEEEARAYMVADNQHARNSSWDAETLQKTLSAIGIGPESVELPEIGFSEKSLRDVLGDNSSFLSNLTNQQGAPGQTFDRRGDNLVEVKFAMTPQEREEVIWRLAAFREKEGLDKTSDALILAIRNATNDIKRPGKL